MISKKKKKKIPKCTPLLFTKGGDNQNSWVDPRDSRGRPASASFASGAAAGAGASSPPPSPSTPAVTTVEWDDSSVRRRRRPRFLPVDSRSFSLPANHKPTEKREQRRGGVTGQIQNANGGVGSTGIGGTNTITGRAVIVAWSPRRSIVGPSPPTAATLGGRSVARLRPIPPPARCAGNGGKKGGGCGGNEVIKSQRQRAPT